MTALAVEETRRFGKYTLVAKLAQGGMAEIFLARLGGVGGFEKLVCIKRILPHLADDTEFVRMFLDEARVAARISHPNVCQVFELAELEGCYYIAMEYLQGVPVSAFRKRRLYAIAPDPQLVVGIVSQACEGLHHAHQLRGNDGMLLGVVHRDVSPANLFVTADGVVKVLDFGIAKMRGASHKTVTGSVKGTYAYMAPEQLRGEPIDQRADVFALGAVTWEILARRPLFRRETDFLTFQAITRDPIPDVCEVRPDVSPELSAVIARALERDPARRFPTARALGTELLRASALFGGPAPAATIGDEVVRAFSAQLEHQRELIAVAEEGGGFDLAVHRPSPISRARSPISIVRAVEAPPRRASWWIPVVALIVMAGGGAMFYIWVNRTPPPDVVAATPIAAPDAPVVEVVPEPAEVFETVLDDPPPAAGPLRAHKVRVRKPTGEPGQVTIDSTPYATIYIDGKSYGDTPVTDLQLPPGKHTVQAKTKSGATKRFTITVESGKATIKQIDW